MTRPKEILKFSANKFDEIDLDHYISNSLLGRFDFLDLVLLVWLRLVVPDLGKMKIICRTIDSYRNLSRAVGNRIKNLHAVGCCLRLSDVV